MPTCANTLCHADLPGHARFCPRCGQRCIRRRKNFGWITWLAIPMFFVVGFRVQSKTNPAQARPSVNYDAPAVSPHFGPSRSNGNNYAGRPERSERSYAEPMDRVAETDRH